MTTSGADWVDQARRLFDAFAAGTAPKPAGRTPTDDDAHRSDCSWCPLCQAAAVVRGERPEVTAALADVLASTATALRAFADSVPPAETGTPPAADDGPEPEPPPVVQRIEIA